MEKYGTCTPTSPAVHLLTNTPWAPASAEMQVPKAIATAVNTPSRKAGSTMYLP